MIPRTLLGVLALLSFAGCDRGPRQAPAPPAPPPPDVTSDPVGPPIEAVLTDAPNVPPPIFRRHPAHVVVHLTVNELEREIAPGVRYTFWTFGGHVPGKFIRVRQGDVVELHLQSDPHNKLPHSIDLHAVLGPGGGAPSTFTAPGHESVFTFRALRAGLFVYHCATAPVPMHVANGMYGLILVEPPGGLPPVSREYYVMQGELYTTGAYHAQGLQSFDMQKGIDERPTYVVFDGAEGSLTGDHALTAETGDVVRIYFGNGGPNLDSNFHVIGEVFDRVYPEGGLRPEQDVQTTVVPPGGATIVDFTTAVPGTYALVDHALFRAFDQGAIGELHVTGPSRNDVYSQKLADVPYAGGAIVDDDTAPTPAAAGDALGQATFARICAACHQAQGQGLPNTFPPLAHSDYLMSAPKEKIIGHVLHGLQGPVTVRGATYNGVMPPMAFLSDDEIAAVLTYVRGSFGNHLDPVTPAEVAKVRGQTASAP